MRRRMRGKAAAKPSRRQNFDSSRSSAPAGVVAVLLASPGITADGLDMSGGVRTDAHFRPCGRNHQGTDAPQGSFVFDPLSPLRHVIEGARLANSFKGGAIGGPV